ncbi:MAG TPA: 50S ribosomal protein L11 methyltransferase [Stellaceae bacterium]|nr:50S ribosomal protein L11 methyltransferase [Stellaceae bacterium]
MVPNSEIEQMIATFQRAVKGRADYPVRMIGLAQVVANKKQPLRAFELCREAIAAGAGDPEVGIRARRLLSSLIPGYHVRMMNDARRNVAWTKAFSRAIHPGTRALEIGTGAGMLALMAARAGAAKITTCERDPILACLASEIIARNGLAERIDVIAKPSRQLVPGEDVDVPADLLFCDIFGDHLFNFEPLAVLADARRRLTKPGAVVVPAAGAIRVALADWERYGIFGHVDRAADFDITPFADFVPAAITVPIGDGTITLKSAEMEAFRFDFAALSHPAEGRTELTLVAAEDAEVKGIVHWIRLELDADTILEARPEPGTISLSSPRFWPFVEPVAMRGGDTLRVVVAHDGRRLTIWPA